jgi:hypothetical protein
VLELLGKRRSDENIMGRHGEWGIFFRQDEGCIFCELPKQDNDRESHPLPEFHTFIIMNRYPYNNGHIMVVPLSPSLSLDGLMMKHCLIS